MKAVHACGAEIAVAGETLPATCPLCGGGWKASTPVVAALERLADDPRPKGASRRAMQALLASDVWIPGRLRRRDGTLVGEGDVDAEDIEDGTLELLRIMDEDLRPFLPVFTDETRLESFMAGQPDDPGALTFPFDAALHFLVDRSYLGMAVNPGQPECLLLYRDTAESLLAGRFPKD
jgi:hypothetical protein